MKKAIISICAVLDAGADTFEIEEYHDSVAAELAAQLAATE